MKSLTKVMIATVMIGLTVPALAQGRPDDASRERDRSRHHERDRDHDDRSAERATPRPTPAGWLSRDEVTRKLAAGGFKVDRIKAEHGRYEVHATDELGARLELHVRPTNGEIIRRERADRD